MAGRSYVDRAIGPRRIGGIYQNGKHGAPYRVLDIDRNPKEGSWRIKVEAVDPMHPNAGAWRHGPVWHSTAWPREGKVVKQPEWPEPHTYGQAAGDALQRWLEEGGGRTAGKGRAIMEGRDPEDVNAELVGWDEDGSPVFKPGKQKGEPELRTGHTKGERDDSLINTPEVLTGALGGETGEVDLQALKQLTDEQIEMLIESIYGKKGAIRNSRAVPFKLPQSTGGRRPKFDIPSSTGGGGAPPPLFPGLVTGGIGAGLADLMGGTKGTPGFKAPPGVTRKALLAQLARNQAKANGYVA